MRDRRRCLPSWSPILVAPHCMQRGRPCCVKGRKGDFLNFAKDKAGAPDSAGNCAGRGSFYFSQLGIPTSTHKQKKKKKKKKKTPIVVTPDPRCSNPLPRDPEQVIFLLRASVSKAEKCVCVCVCVCVCDSYVIRRVHVRIQRECGCHPALESSLQLLLPAPRNSRK